MTDFPSADRAAPAASIAPSAPSGTAETGAPRDVERLSDLSSTQWKSGAAAWLGWLFDGLDMHLYTLVATPFVAELLHLDKTDKQVGYYSSWIMAAFLIGWALGGGFFGRLGDRIGRSRALMLTILTYASFTGLSYFAQTWWQLLIFRFLAALGIGGEWAVGASLLSETWPKRWRPWMAAVLQTGVNLGTMLAGGVLYVLAGQPHRTVFLAGIVPAFLVLWIRRYVPESAEWHAAKAHSGGSEARIVDLFRGGVRKTTLLTIAVCSLSLTGHWAFLFWYLQQVRHLPELIAWSPGDVDQLVSQALSLVMLTSIAGNFLAAAIARVIGYRLSIVLMCLGYFGSMMFAYYTPRDYDSLYYCLAAIGVFQGVFALFTMYLPPLFPTLLRTTGAGFCYNIGRIAAALGTVYFGLYANLGDYRPALLAAGFLFIPAAVVAMFLPTKEWNIETAGIAGPVD